MTTDSANSRPNHLVNETSPYLLQHAYNPVDWYPWGPEALNKAKQENKPIFLSIGYSACHWCHVMEEESFSNAEIAAQLNAHFVSIKVDREERPDLDHIYQECAQLLTEQGGWPLSAFLTPDLQPFYIGTYFPPAERYGRPGFSSVLSSLSELFQDDPQRIQELGEDISQALIGRHAGGSQQEAEIPEAAVVDEARQFLLRVSDRQHGGFGRAPKFPCTPNLQLLLPAHSGAVGDSHCDTVLFTLRQMAAGGIYDQIGGGFHRYSTDAKWLVPHFEKMLYDNALLPPVYLAAFQLTGESQFAQVVVETLDYVLREMTHAEGGFFSAQDADSEGVEGKFYVWRATELAAVLKEDDLRLCVARYGVTPKGNFEAGTSILHQAKSLSQLADGANLTEAEVERQLQGINQQLLAERGKRVWPLRDDKILAGWNGMMASAFAKAGLVLQKPEYVTAATRALDFIWEQLRNSEGYLLRSWKARPGKHTGFLEDYIFVCQALLDAYSATFDLVHLNRAQELMQLCIAQLWDNADGGFYMSPPADDLLHRPKDLYDQSIPAANGVAAQVMLRLHSVAPQKGYLEKAETMLAAYGTHMRQNPWGMASLIKALDMYQRGVTEIVVVTPDDLNDKRTQELLAVISAHYLYGAMVYVKAQTDTELPAACVGKELIQGEAAVHICRNFTCSAPLGTTAEVEAALKAL